MSGDMNVVENKTPAQGGALEVFAVFLKLGLTSFGGPIAHLGYFRDELVTRRRWLSDSAYADLVALCQFLPGPASSQVGFALGLMRGGWLGALAAFTAFTAPSALLLFIFAMSAASLSSPLGLGVLHGLKIVAVAIVAQAVWGMLKNLCPDRQRIGIALGTLALLAFVPTPFTMLAAIALGALAGLALCPGVSAGAGRANAQVEGERMAMPVRRWQAVAALTLCAVLAAAPLLALMDARQGAGGAQALAVFDSFYRAGALVFGGGHVVLPLLQGEVVQPGWVTPDQFLAGYGAAQAAPGPLFTFAAYLGAVLKPWPNGVFGAALALLAIFTPGFLFLIAALPFWERFRAMSKAQSLMQGANAAVVGILGAALYDPVFTSAIGDLRDLALALLCFALLMAWKTPPWVVVTVGALGGAVLGWL